MSAGTANVTTTSFSCSNCGATTNAVALGSSIRCPFCGSEHVISGPVDPGAPQPEALIPFSFPDANVEPAYRKWLGEGFFRPKDITSKANSHKMQAVYIPVWDTSAHARSSWTAQAGYTENVPGTGDQSSNSQTRTRWEQVSGSHSESYERLLISASKGLPQDWLDRLDDLDWGQIKGFDPSYLLGREVEQSVLDRSAAVSAAREEIEERERNACTNLVPGDTQKDVRVSTEISDVKSRLVYLPVWLASFQYNDKVYRCIVNGQTGKVTGDAPLNAFRVGAVIAGVVGLIAAIVLLIVLLG